tara:strand:- start:105 stop:344 length:240 start_codon:yes stop_codon:yes gene_type:complete
MPSRKSKFLKTALRIIEIQPAGFKALEEFEKTGKTLTKTRLNFTIDRELAKDFRIYCKTHRLNMSEQVENMIKTKLKVS